MMKDQSFIKEYFKGKNVFITGGSGFIGKALIEKLLRSCPDVGKIYVLLRPKKGKILHERVEQILSSPLFDILKNKTPESLQKIVPINGNTCAPNLALSESDRQLLRDEVHIVIHGAASVRFDDPLVDAIISNIRSARDVALLALEMKHVEVLLHVSTAYCNIDNNRKSVKEILYPAPQSWSEAISIAENCNPNIVDILTNKYMGDFPNTYTFTKRLAEHCINDLLIGKVPVIISRPTVVIGSLEEPFEGWTDNFNGPVGLLLAGVAGFLRVLYSNPDINPDYNAVDNTVKTLLCSIWQKATFGDGQELSIFHLSKNDSIPYKLKNLQKYKDRYFWEAPLEKKIWVPQCKITTFWYEYYIRVIILHVIPALFLDTILRIVRYPPMLLKIQRKIYIANMALAHFLFNEWRFENENLMALISALPEKEKKDFNCLILPEGEECIYNYMSNCGDYCRVHLLNEPKEITQANRNKTLRMYYLDKAVKLIFVVMVPWLLLVKINVPKILWNITYNYWNNL